LDEIAFAACEECDDVFEPVMRLRNHLSNGSGCLVECPAVRRSEVPELLEKVRLFYQAAYESMRWNDGRASEWDRLVARTQSADLPNRLIVRQAVDLLDALRFS
jgi:hypothetical protein